MLFRRESRGLFLLIYIYKLNSVLFQYFIFIFHILLSTFVFFWFLIRSRQIYLLFITWHTWYYCYRLQVSYISSEFSCKLYWKRQKNSNSLSIQYILTLSVFLVLLKSIYYICNFILSFFWIYYTIRSSFQCLHDMNASKETYIHIILLINLCSTEPEKKVVM